jgi:hypothetical protein
MMWAMRRQYSGDVKYCWPVSLQPPVSLTRHAAGHQRLGVDGLPVLELRRRVDIGDLLDEGRLIDRREQPAALEIVGDDLCHADADFVVRRGAGDEIRDRDRQGCDIAFGDLHACLAKGRARARSHQQAGRRHSGNDLSATRAKQHVGQSIFIGHCYRLCLMSVIVSSADVLMTVAR